MSNKLNFLFTQVTWKFFLAGIGIFFNVFLNFLKANTKVLAKFVKSRDRKKIALGVESIISGLTNGLDAFKKDKF